MASFLRDDKCVADAVRHLATAIRTALRSSCGSPPAASLNHLPAIDPPPGAAIHNHPSVTELSALPAPEAAAVLILLHPLELCHLPEPLISAALCAYTSSGTPVDLRAPTPGHGRPALPHWESHCQFTLSALLKQPSSLSLALCLSHVGRATAAYLRDLAPRLASLTISHSSAPPVLTFLSQATALTHLDVAASHTPRASLLEALLGLRHLQALTLNVPALTTADLERLTAAARFSPAAVADSPALQPLSHALAAVSHVSLMQPIAPAAAESCWPPLLSCLLDFSKLRHFTCFPTRLSPQHPLHSGPPPLSLESLTFPSAPEGCGWPLHDEPGRETCPDVDALILAASTPSWAPLTRLDLHACTPAASIAALLRHFPQLRRLSLGRCPPDCLTALQHSLLSLPYLQSLDLQAVDHGPPGVSALCHMLCALRALPITHLHIRHAPPPWRCSGPFTALSGLEDLQWEYRMTEHSGHSFLRADKPASAIVCEPCTSLTMLRLALPALLQCPDDMTSALGGLQRLRQLHLELFYGTVGTLWPRSSPIKLPELRDLTVSFDLPQALIEQTQRLNCWRAPALTRLQLSSSKRVVGGDGGGVPYACALASVLPGFQMLEGLHVPLDVFSDAPEEAAGVLGPVLAQLTRLERLDARAADNSFVRCLWPHLRSLPLRQGFL